MTERPDFSEYPDWVQFDAVDEDGSLWVFEGRPDLSKDCWLPDFAFVYDQWKPDVIYDATDWRNSLRERPKQ